jgi:hypothetical protein
MKVFGPVLGIWVASAVAVLLWPLMAVGQTSPCCSCACIDDDGDEVGQLWRCQVAGPPDATHCAEDFVVEQVVGQIPFCGGGRVFKFPPDFCTCVGGMCFICSGVTCSPASEGDCAKEAAQACFDEFDGSAVPCDDDGVPGPDPCPLP